MTPEESQFLIDMRMKVLKNKEEGLPARDGISDEEIARFTSLLQGGRSSASAVSEKKAKAKAPAEPVDLKALFS